MTATYKSALESLTNRLNNIVKQLQTETDPDTIQEMLADIRDISNKINRLATENETTQA